MVRVVDGDIFESECHALVNPVNCVGVSGKGLAKEFKKRFPEAVGVYERQARRGGVWQTMPLYLATYVTPGPWIIFAPTKHHWRYESSVSGIDTVCDRLGATIKAVGLKSVAIPALGCGNGGLRWTDVEGIMRDEFLDSAA